MKPRPRNIQRSDRRAFHGWSVHLTRRGRHYTRFFADKRYGSKAAALRAALEYRDDQLLALYPPLRIRRFFPRNNTGVVGVFLENRRVEGRLYPRYGASWPIGPQQTKRRYFSVKTFGKRRAFELAVEARRAGVEELERKVRGSLALEVVRRRTSKAAR